MDFSALYVHIPFCVRKCNYCDFVSYPVMDSRDWLGKYGHLLLKELDSWQYRADLSGIETLYVGGGTPTVLPQLPGLVSAVREKIKLTGIAEVTVECNPGTVAFDSLLQLREAGVNRISIGIESLNDQELKDMGRFHDAAAGVKAVAEVKRAGFDNINIDLIYGLPGQTMSGWQETVKKSLELSTRHISFYGLTLSEQTPWGKALAAGELELPEDELTSGMMESAAKILTDGGFRHYEIANFAQPGYESRHNTAYWQRNNYLGLGVSASGCCDDWRYTNHRDLALYASAVEADESVVTEEEYLSREEVLAEAMFLGLRFLEGIDLARFAARYGVKAEEYFADQISRLVSLGLLVKTINRLKLTGKGILLANEVFMQFLP